jgi:hypothetical protein
MPAQAVTRDGYFPASRRELGRVSRLQSLVPALHVRYLPEGPAKRSDLKVIGCLVIACCVVYEFGGTKTHDEFFRQGVSEERAAETRSGVRLMVYNGPTVRNDLVGLSGSESACAVVAPN